MKVAVGAREHEVEIGRYFRLGWAFERDAFEARRDCSLR